MCHELSYLRRRERSALKTESEPQDAKKSPSPEPVKEPAAKPRVVEPA
jgi:hypothetical protein